MCLSLFFYGFDLMELSAHLAQNARLAASVVTFGAFLMWSVVEYFSCMNLLAGSSCSHWSFRTHLEPPAAIWSHLESSGAVWSHLEPSGVIYLEPSGAIWRYLDLSGAIWSYLEPSGAFWSHLGHLQLYGIIWSLLEPSQAIWTHLRVVRGDVTICYHSV